MGVAVGDLNGNRYPDVVFANNTQPNRVCLNDRYWSFTCTDVSSGNTASQGVALGDVDGDGDLDAVFANSSGSNSRVCLNDWTGVFSCANLNGDLRRTRAVAAIGGPIFVDGFESGDDTAWDLTMP